MNPTVTVSVGLTRLFYISFLTGMTISGVVYVGMHYVFPDGRLKAFVHSAALAEQVMAEYEEQYDLAVEIIHGEALGGKMDA